VSPTRRGPALDGPLFPNTLDGFRDPNNTRSGMREARGNGLLSWATSHNFRKSVATILDDAGHSGRQVADQIGHSQVSLAQNAYLARKVANPQAARDIEQFLNRRTSSVADNERMGKGWVRFEHDAPASRLTCGVVGRRGLEPRTYGLKVHSSAN
jgi:hypothetical protein